MKSGSCVRAALLAAAVVTFAAPAMGQATDPGKLSEAQQKEIYCVLDKVVTRDDDAIDVAEAYVFADDSKQIERAEKAVKAASDACSTAYNWDASKEMLSTQIGVASLAIDYLAEDLRFEGLKDEEIDLIFLAMRKLPTDDLSRFLDDSWMDDAELVKRLDSALAAAKYPGNDEYLLESGRLVMEAAVLTSVGISDWIRQHIDKK
jgi:hypothetical protein